MALDTVTGLLHRPSLSTGQRTKETKGTWRVWELGRDTSTTRDLCPTLQLLLGSLLLRNHLGPEGQSWGLWSLSTRRTKGTVGRVGLGTSTSGTPGDSTPDTHRTTRDPDVIRPPSRPDSVRRVSLSLEADCTKGTPADTRVRRTPVYGFNFDEASRPSRRTRVSETFFLTQNPRDRRVWKGRGCFPSKLLNPDTPKDKVLTS